MISRRQYKELNDRSGGKCEAMVVGVNGIYSRCWASPVEMHHLLTRGRGGGVLDSVNETYHLIALCHKHHAMSDGGEAYEGGLLIDGYVQTGPHGRPVYYGTDPELRRRYPQ